jgi:hypothetical protein
VKSTINVTGRDFAALSVSLLDFAIANRLSKKKVFTLLYARTGAHSVSAKSRLDPRRTLIAIDDNTNF